jgi:hypothetical protein
MLETRFDTTIPTVRYNSRAPSFARAVLEWSPAVEQSLISLLSDPCAALEHLTGSAFDDS